MGRLISTKPSENPATSFGYVSTNIGNLNHRAAYDLKDLIVKTEETWKASLKGIARDLNYKKLDKSIKVDEKTEESINSWRNYNFNKSNI